MFNQKLVGILDPTLLVTTSQEKPVEWLTYLSSNVDWTYVRQSF
jgi:hypothetical protein